ncbi:GNAT family N-acetyltransferase [Actinopolymorpha pittospori]|uniref:Ribosomal protein S18 acetylase RimI-like enzyme n=1 Tax=Actinopolymorpha pittospori TaxID=648752 RepID=A0A927MUB4_9ACTN|nr:GNAT family N-acetyltransferase [Actinopolymorpha pittospori]MBE1606491.1 ribosomal protein S18 acetylase RimI-like enzyme [Actinopolymorpha pittospori]
MAVEYAIRPPRPADATSLGHVHIRIWREAYVGLMPQQFLDKLDPRQSTIRWLTMLEQPDERVTRLIGLAEQEIVGFIAVGPARDDDAPTSTELQVINVLAAHHGTGLANQLLTAALGDAAAYLWVVEGNERALAFYRRHRFAVDGAAKKHPGTGVNELRMVRVGGKGLDSGEGLDAGGS